MLNLTAAAEDRNRRVDSFVAHKISELSRSFINQLLDDGKIMVDGKVVKPSYKIKLGNNITIDIDLETLKNAPKIDIPIIYEDDDVIVMDKPPGVLTHSKGAYNPEGTVATYIADKVKDLDGNRAGIAHRLDRRTSGVIIAAKNPAALKWLQKQFSGRRTIKLYLAVIEGTLEPETAIIDMPIERNPNKPHLFRVGMGGKSAVTEYRTLEISDKCSLVELKPKTGRTHQLRVHMSKRGHPIIGDDFYGAKPADRLYLHAQELDITLPNGARKRFVSPAPRQFKDILN